jgi:CBS domain containing-hemolysin-like protein
MDAWVTDLLKIMTALLLVMINGFFVAVEFALVKLREGQLNELIKKQRPFARTALWLQQRLDASLSACQLGITMASLGLGWIGEPAIAHLLRPLLIMVGITSDLWIHTIAFIIAFTSITAAHLVVGEQTPKIFALRRPETMALWCAVPLKIFYYVSYPLISALNASTSFLLTLAGVDSTSSHQDVPTADEIRVLLQQARTHGHISRSEHRLISAVLEFDDLVCRKVIQPRADVDYLDIDQPIEMNLDLVNRAGIRAIRCARDLWTTCSVRSTSKILTVCPAVTILTCGRFSGRRNMFPKPYPSAGCCVSSRHAASTWPLWWMNTALLPVLLPLKMLSNRLWAR